MEKRCKYLAALFFVLSCFVACGVDQENQIGSASQEVDASNLGLKMPLPAGYRWKVNTNPGFQTPEVQFHSEDYFHAIDFGDNVYVDNQLYDLEDGRIDVLAAADGIVSFVKKDGCASGVGNAACRVFINHSGSSKHYNPDSNAGYETEYTHLSPGSAVLVSVGQAVKQGQPIGKMGKTGTVGTHLHFGVYYNGNASENNPALSGLELEGVLFANYALDQRYPSNNHNNDSVLPIPGVLPWKGAFDFSPDSTSLYACTDTVSLTTFTCQNRQTAYQPGDNVNIVVRTDNAHKDIVFSVEAWRNGQNSPDWTWTDPKLYIEPGVWPFAYYLPRFNNVYVGDWEMRIFADVGNGSFKLATFPFTVLGNQQWPGSPYQYNGNQYHCKGGVTGGDTTGWIYTCNNPQSSYVVGDVVSVMARIDNVASSHTFEARVFRSVNNGASWSHVYTSTPVSNTVPVGQIWPHAFFWTNINADQVGLYEVRIGIDLPGTDFDNAYLAAIQFTVSPSSNPPAAYTYNGNSATCANEPTGGNNTGWIYTCPRPATVFSPLQDIRVFAYVENVRESYKFRTRFYLNGSSTPSEQVETPLQTVPNGEVWGRAYAWPALWDAPSGSWRASLEIHTNSTGWQMLKSNITFTVNQPVAGYIPGSLNLCRGSVEPERDSSGVPQCLTPVSSVSPFFTYYWRLHFTSLTSSHQFRVEAYQNGMLSWSYNFGPYSAPSNGHAWFFPQFANPAGPSNWEMLFFVKIGSGNFQQVDAYSFYSL